MIVWNETYSVGDDELDKQHKQIIDMLNSMADIDDVQSEELHSVLNDMLEYAHDHLKYEEELLNRMNYHDFDNHVQKHWEYLARVSEMSFSASLKNPDVAVELVEYLIHWWNNHILKDDMEYKSMMVNNGKS